MLEILVVRENTGLTVLVLTILISRTGNLSLIPIRAMAYSQTFKEGDTNSFVEVH